MLSYSLLYSNGYEPGELLIGVYLDADNAYQTMLEQQMKDLRGNRSSLWVHIHDMETGRLIGTHAVTEWVDGEHRAFLASEVRERLLNGQLEARDHTFDSFMQARHFVEDFDDFRQVVATSHGWAFTEWGVCPAYVKVDGKLTPGEWVIEPTHVEVVPKNRELCRLIATRLLKHLRTPKGWDVIEA